MTPEEVVKELEDAADRQDHFAGPEYIQCTETDRKMFRHAARMLRLVAQRFRAKYGLTEEK